MKLNFAKTSIVAMACILANAGIAWSAVYNGKHEIMVYSLQQYETAYDDCEDEYKSWKHSVPVYDEYDPYDDFWDEMYTSCSSSMACAAVASVRRQNSAVTRDSIVGSSDGWHDADLVFFYGHNTMIQPQWDLEF